MAHLIVKDALVAEIESKKKYAQTLGDNAINSSMQQFYDGLKQGCVDILSFLDTLEVKEMDLVKEVDDWYNTKASKEFENVLYRDIENCAKHFFELGMQVSNKAQKGE